MLVALLVARRMQLRTFGGSWICTTEPAVVSNRSQTSGSRDGVQPPQARMTMSARSVCLMHGEFKIEERRKE